MYLLHRKKIDIYANISLFVLIPRSLHSPDQMVDQHLETTSTALNVSGDQTPRWAPETDPQWGPRHLDSHQDKTSGTSWALQSDFAAVGIELLCRLARGEMAPRLSLVSPKVFFSVLSPMEFWFLAAVASGLLSWGHFISSNIVDLIEQKPFELNWAGRCHHWIQ